MHTCCAPCFIAPWQHLKKIEGLELRAFWYNPNIQPYQEFRKRLEALRDFCEKESIPLIENDTYDIERFLQGAVYRENNRCEACYYDRLEMTVKTAVAGKFTHFSSVLLYSKFQNHEKIVEISKALAVKYKIEFYYEDFREYWKEGIELSKADGMYRQQYCGCIYSERDRYENYYKRLDAKAREESK